ncbi:hypothetical protein HELRODRAFT_152883, partial [Helobdella robusta]|uniref:DUF4605 domain-containing protein n=1 Tax=Helobdella robusta TaxID=6412 RepID=T1EKX7_HELRO
MMKILANGEIVQDDDPRVQAKPQASTRSAKQTTQDIRRHNVETIPPNDANVVAHGPSYSIFDTLNNQLVSVGVPTWNLGPYPVKPIVSVGFILSIAVMGFRGLLFSGLLFFVVNYSQ